MIYSVVVIINWGFILGKVKGDICWFLYDGKEYDIKNFVWLMLMRLVKRKKNEGSFLRLVIVCGF